MINITIYNFVEKMLNILIKFILYTSKIYNFFWGGAVRII